MILKPYEKRDRDLSILSEMLAATDLKPAVREKIEREAAKIRSGDQGERDVAYELDFHFGTSGNVAVLHDLRIEVEGRVAQIDHLVLTRFLEAYVIESKNFRGGLSVNDHGEFVTFMGNRPVAIASPVAQNDRHVQVLKDAAKRGVFEMPKRLGVRMPFMFRSVIAVGNGTRVSRPRSDVRGIDRIVKADQVRELVRKDQKDESLLTTAASAMLMVSQKTLRRLGESIAAAHVPIEFDWHARLGVAKVTSAEPAPAARPKPPRPLPAAAEAAGEKSFVKEPGTATSCEVCGEVLDSKVAWFCRRYSKRFGGRLLCREHQADTS